MESIFLAAIVVAVLVYGASILADKINSYLAGDSVSSTELDTAIHDFSMFERRPYLFDNRAEFDLYKDLINICGPNCYVFPQVHYIHLVKPKGASKFEMRRHRSRIDKKSADFVICDRATAVPRLVIELDGSSHRYADRKERDAFIDELMKHVGLPILHVQRRNINKTQVRQAVESVLVRR